MSFVFLSVWAALRSQNPWCVGGRLPWHLAPVLINGQQCHKALRTCLQTSGCLASWRWCSWLWDEQFAFRSFSPQYKVKGNSWPIEFYAAGLLVGFCPICQRFPNFSLVLYIWSGRAMTQASKREATFKAHWERSVKFLITLPNTCLRGQTHTQT